MLLCFLTLYTQNSEKYHLPFFVHSQNDLAQPMSSNISTQYHISCDFSMTVPLYQAPIWHRHLAPCVYHKHLTRSLSDTHLLFSASPWFCTSQIPPLSAKLSQFSSKNVYIIHESSISYNSHEYISQAADSPRWYEIIYMMATPETPSILAKCLQILLRKFPGFQLTHLQ